MNTDSHEFFVIILFGILTSGSYGTQDVGDNGSILGQPEANNNEKELGTV